MVKRSAEDVVESDGEDVISSNREAGPSDAHPDQPGISRPSSSKSKKKSKRPTPGIVYISRLPPGMTPQKVRHLMAKWGDVGKVYAQRKDAVTGYDPHHNEKKKKTHVQANFSEAWVEFLDKAVAKTVAKMLNAQVIGGKKGDRWRDDIWTMRYLSGFKWEMLGEQVAYEKQAHQARLRNEIARSKSEQSEYLKNVELARVLNKRKAKTSQANGDDKVLKEISRSSAASSAEGAKARRDYKQRKTVEGNKDGGGMEGVLASVFG
ncbi:hypothetical protein BD324DRAFT_648271 [Kockovaella imperatae]|uniref:18S rRNA factor 2 n=1 Tax=Kockovaella imperatae TaxID=4999 RepID=A0A1Y1UNL5_9TREE|nr:hypothetical protein BD324DRAFT_648271 [Kockovaella imperatae]ORX39633.1 hypothetical protein BD324DRAFT_648271 [Kockovaella imperatae]